MKIMGKKNRTQEKHAEGEQPCGPVCLPGCDMRMAMEMTGCSFDVERIMREGFTEEEERAYEMLFGKMIRSKER